MLLLVGYERLTERRQSRMLRNEALDLVELGCGHCCDQPLSPDPRTTASAPTRIVTAHGCADNDSYSFFNSRFKTLPETVLGSGSERIMNRFGRL